LNPGPDGSYLAEIEAATGIDPTTPESNIAGGCHKLSKFLERYGDPATAVMAYRTGRAKEKLRHIVINFGDADGARNTTGYIAQLVIKAMQAEALRLWTATNYPQRDEGPAQRPPPQGHTNIILRSDPKSQEIFCMTRTHK